MNRYNKEELESFRILDEKKYLVSHNPEIMIWLDKLKLVDIEDNFQLLKTLKEDNKQEKKKKIRLRWFLHR